MELDPNFSEFIGLLHAREVRFLVVGGYAVAFHGHPRYTADLDIWLRGDASNAERVIEALRDFGFGDLGLSVDDLTRADQVVQLGYPPVRIDLLTGVEGLEFEEAWERRVETDLGGVAVPFVSLEDLRRNKAAAGRAQDVADLEALPDPGHD